MRDACGERAPRRVTAHREAARVTTHLGGVLGEPGHRREAVRTRGLERVLGSAAVARGHDDRPAPVGERAAHATRGVEVAGDEPAAVEPGEHRSG